MYTISRTCIIALFGPGGVRIKNVHLEKKGFFEDLIREAGAPIQRGHTMRIGMLNMSPFFYVPHLVSIRVPL